MSDVPSVEVTEEALGDVARQLDPDAAWSFARLDMLPALESMAAPGGLTSLRSKAPQGADSPPTG